MPSGEVSQSRPSTSVTGPTTGAPADRSWARSSPAGRGGGRVPPGRPAGGAHLLRPRVLRLPPRHVLATRRLLEGCVRVRVPRLVSQRQRAATG